MDGQEYLNQISAKTQQEKVKKTKSGILGSKFFLVGVIGVALFIFLIVIGMILGGNKSNDKTKCIELALHLNNTGEVISEYQPNVKSSELRSSSSSLYSVLSTANNKLTDYLANKYGMKGLKDADEKLIEQAKAEQDALNTELFEAKINGILDRVYAHEMAYEITIILAEEDKLQDATNDETLEAIISESYSSLKNLYDKFNDFSETK